MDYFNMTAPCGRDCFNCPVFKAKEDTQLQKKISETLSIPIEKVRCQGCRNENGTIPYLNMEAPCKVYSCIENKKLDFCFKCEDFPCDYLHPYADMANIKPHNLKVFNLCLIKKMGLENWAKEKALDVLNTYYTKKFEI